MGQEFIWVQGAIRWAPSAIRAARTCMNSGEALRRAGLDDEQCIFTGLPKGNGCFPCPGKRQFSQGISGDNQIGRCLAGRVAQIGMQRLGASQRRVAALGGKGAGQLQERQIIVEEHDSRNTGIGAGCRPSGRARTRTRVEQAPGRKLRAPFSKFGQAEYDGRIGGRQPRHKISGKIQRAAGTPALPVTPGHAGGFVHQGSRFVFGEIPVDCRLQLGMEWQSWVEKFRFLARLTVRSVMSGTGGQVRLSLYPSNSFKWN